MSKGTFPGIGKWAGHTIGQFIEDLNDIRPTISQLLTLNLNGIPLVGTTLEATSVDLGETVAHRYFQAMVF